MIILGLDPGMTRLGHSTVKVDGDELSLISYGLISNPQDSADKFNVHLNKSIHQITDDLPRLIGISNPSLIVAETVPPVGLGSNQSLVIAAITTCKVIAYQFGINWIDVGANTVKKEFTGDAKASKAKVRNAVIDAFPAVGDRHQLMKKDQKRAGEKVEGIPQDVFDAIAVSVIGAKLYANSSEDGNQDVR